MCRHYAECRTQITSLIELPLDHSGIAERLYMDHVRLFMCAVGPDFPFMDENARPNLAAEASGTLERKNNRGIP